MKHEIVISGAPFGEGPVWCPDGTLVISHVAPGGLRRIWPERGVSEVIASMAGGANAAQLASDGGFVVTQNGGFDFADFAEGLGMGPGDVPHFAPGTPGLQRVRPDGSVIYLADRGFQAPNDLIVAPDGTIYFTDPPALHRDPAPDGGGRLWSYAPDGALRRVADGFAYDNGIALSPDGRLLVVEGSGLLWVSIDGEREWLVETLPAGSAGDGFCFDADGRVYVCSPAAHCIQVLDPSGAELDRIDMDDGVVTNVCFGGDDGRTLFSAELWPGCVRAVEGLPTPGLPLTPWPVPSR